MPLATSFNSISSISKSSLNNVNIEVISGASSSSATYSRVWNYRYIRGSGSAEFHIYGTGPFDIVLLGGGGAGGGRASSNAPRAGGGGGAGGFVTINDLSISNGYAYAEATSGSGGVGQIGTRVSGGDTTVTFYTDSTKETIIQTITAPGGGGGGYATSTRGQSISGLSEGSNGGGGGVTLPFSGNITGSHSGYNFLDIDPNYRDFSTGYTINSGLNGGQGGYASGTATTPYAVGGGGGGLWDGTSFGSTFTMNPYPGTFISDSNYLYPIFGEEVRVAAGGEGSNSLGNYSGETTPGYGNGGGGRGGNSSVTTSGAGLTGTDGAFAFIYAR